MPVRAGRLLLVLAVAVVAAVAVTIMVSSVSAGGRAAGYGLPDPGLFSTYGVPVAVTLAMIGATVCVGSLLFATFLVSPDSSGLLTTAGRQAVRRAACGATLWFLSAGLAVPLVVAVERGEPFAQVVRLGTVITALGSTAQARTWAGTCAIAFLLAVVATAVRSWRGALGLLVVAVCGLVPLAVSGHSASGAAHDLAEASLLYHLVASALWVGGLIALLGAAGTRSVRPPERVLAATRFSRLALVCWCVVAGSGAVNALVRMPVTDLLDTLYGRLVTAKIIALVVLGGFGRRQRRHSLHALRRRADATALLRFGGGEILVMLATVGLAVALAQTPPPTLTAPISGTEAVLGYRLAGPPTLARLALGWRFDALSGVVAIALAAAYLLGVRRLRLFGATWPRSRTISWLAGCAVLLLATSSGVGRYAPALFSVHIGQTMLIGLWAPVLLALGGPITLALRALPDRDDGVWGGREWLGAVLDSPTLRVLTRPAVALTLFVVTVAALSATGVVDLAPATAVAALAVQAIGLIVGYLLFWAVIGVDPIPGNSVRRPGLAAAAGLGGAALGGALLVGVLPVLGDAPDQHLALPWAPNRLADQHLGGAVALIGGVLCSLGVLVAWAMPRSRSRQTAARTAGQARELEQRTRSAMPVDAARAECSSPSVHPPDDTHDACGS